MDDRTLASCMQYIGNHYQLYGTRRYRLTEGYSSDVNAIDVKTGGGLQYTVIPDRSLDISFASYQGENFTYVTPNGEVHPAHYDKRDSGWLRTFMGGLLTTCGYENIGPACERNGEHIGLHGRESAIPARNVRVSNESDGCIRISGEIENSMLFSYKVRRRRTIVSPILKNEIRVYDEYENYGCKPAPLYLLYHMNFGFPFLTENSVVTTSAARTVSCDAYSEGFLDEISRFSPPRADLSEKNYYYAFEPADGYGVTRIEQPGRYGVSIRQKLDTLPILSHWKMENPVDYVTALEPSNAPCYGRDALEEQGMQRELQPGETAEIEIIIRVYSLAEK